MCPGTRESRRPLSSQPSADGAPIRELDQDPANWGPPSLSFSSGITGLSDVNSAFNRNRNGRAVRSRSRSIAGGIM